MNIKGHDSVEQWEVTLTVDTEHVPVSRGYLQNPYFSTFTWAISEIPLQKSLEQRQAILKVCRMRGGVEIVRIRFGFILTLLLRCHEKYGWEIRWMSKIMKINQNIRNSQCRSIKLYEKTMTCHQNVWTVKDFQKKNLIFIKIYENQSLLIILYEKSMIFKQNQWFPEPKWVWKQSQENNMAHWVNLSSFYAMNYSSWEHIKNQCSPNPKCVWKQSPKNWFIELICLFYYIMNCSAWEHSKKTMFPRP